jgi:hypothetical protein
MERKANDINGENKAFFIYRSYFDLPLSLAYGQLLRFMRKKRPSFSMKKNLLYRWESILALVIFPRQKIIMYHEFGLLLS